MEASAKHDFVPKDPDTELAFMKGDRLLILNYGENVQWYNAAKGGQEGLVPGNYIHIEEQNWYFGRISRQTAEQMLQGNKHDGAFLVRLSESMPSEFSLSVKCGKQVQHFRILKDDDKKYFLWSSTFDSLNRLVEYYRGETVSRTNKIFLRDICSDNQFIVEAIYDFVPEDDSEAVGEIEFKQGDIITVIDDKDPNWWIGNLADRSGYFPKTYVKHIWPPTDRTN